jgi:chromosome segregation protein
MDADHETMQAEFVDAEAEIDRLREALHRQRARARCLPPHVLQPCHLRWTKKDGSSVRSPHGSTVSVGCRRLMQVLPGYEAAIAAARSPSADAAGSPTADAAFAALEHSAKHDFGRAEVVLSEIERHRRRRA